MGTAAFPSGSLSPLPPPRSRADPGAPTRVPIHRWRRRGRRRARAGRNRARPRLPRLPARAPAPRSLSLSLSCVRCRPARAAGASERAGALRVSEPQVDARRGWGWEAVRVGPRRAFRASARPAWRGRRRPTRRTDARPPSWARVRGIRRREPRRSRRGRRRRSSVRPRAPPSGNCIAPRAPACRIASDRIGSRG